MKIVPAIDWDEVKILSSDKILKLRSRTDIFVLISFTIIAQIIAFSFQVIVKSIFTPEDFGKMEIFVRGGNFLAFLFTMRYEYRIYRLKIISTRNLIILGVAVHAALCCLISILIISIFYICKPDLFQIWDLGFNFFIFVVAFGFSIALYRIALIVSSLDGSFKTIGFSRIFRRAIEGGVQVTFSKVIGASSLYLGETFGNLVFFLVVFRKFRVSKFLSSRARLKTSILRFRQYQISSRKFVRSKLPADLIDLYAENVLVIAILSYYSFAEAGFYELSWRLLAAPTALMASSLAPLIFRTYSLHENSYQKLVSSLGKVFTLFVFCAIIYYILFKLFGFFVVETFFGAVWLTSYDYILILMPAILIQFVVSPFGEILVLANKVEWDSRWKIIRAISLSVLLLPVEITLFSRLYWFTIITIFFYIIYLVMILIVIKKRSPQRAFRK